jgi:Helix-turn-helix domain
VYHRKFDKLLKEKLKFQSVHVSEYLPPGESFPVHLLARVLHIHRTHLINLIDAGEIQCAVDLRGHGSSRSTIRVPRAAVIEFLEKRRIVIIPDGKINH